MLLRGWGGGLHRTRAAESKILKYARRPSTFPSRAHRKFLRGPWPSGPRDFYSWNRLMLADGHLRASYRGQLSISHSQPAPRPGPSTRPLDQAPRPDPSNNRRSDSHSPQALFSLFSRAHLPSFLPPPLPPIALPDQPLAGPAPLFISRLKCVAEYSRHPLRPTPSPSLRPRSHCHYLDNRIRHRITRAHQVPLLIAPRFTHYNYLYKLALLVTFTLPLPRFSNNYPRAYPCLQLDTQSL
jgi:hypothetical protein